MAGNKIGSFRVKFEDVENKFKEKGLQLLETEYQGVKHPMKFYCPKHNVISTVKWTDFKQDKGGCKECSKENYKGRTPIEKVRSTIEKKGFELVSTEYINNKSKIALKCPEHGLFETTYDSFTRQKYGCVKCATKINSEMQRTPFDEIKEEYLSNGFVLIDDKFVNWDTPMKCICLNHPDKITYITRGNIRKGGCSQCRIDKMSGENCHLWRGGITPEHRRQRTTREYKQWRKSVYERDNYTCQCCKQRGRRLNAHHIENFSDNEELRLDIHNGITMCNDCHHLSTLGSFHHTYGAVDNDIYQLQEYFDDVRSELGLPLITIESIIYPKLMDKIS